MNKKRNLAEEILAGINDIKAWKQGKKKLRVTQVLLPTASDVAKIRHKLHLDQEEFAEFMGVSIKTLQNWEQQRREPQGPARSLLRVAEKAPEAILKALPRKTTHSKRYAFSAKSSSKKKIISKKPR